MNEILKRIQQIADNEGITITALEKSIGASKGVLSRALSKNTDIQSKWLPLIVDNYPHYDTGWLLTGSGDMMKDALTKAPDGKIKRRIRNKVNPQGVAFYDIDFEAGKGTEFYDDIQALTPIYTSDIPDFNGCVAFRSYGKSMEKIIDAGAWLFATKEADWMDVLEYGQIYGIVCHNKRRYLKYVRRSQRHETHFTLVSENPDFDPFDIPKAKIKSMWLVHGWLNKRT